MIYITIPVYNRKEMLRGCLNSFRKQTFSDYKIIVTDDGSTDGTSDMLKDEFEEVTVIQGDGNLFWTGAINEAVRYATKESKEEDYILVINDDLVVPSDYLENLLNLTKKLRDTIIGSVVVDFNDRDCIHSGGIIINWKTARFRDLNNGKRLSDFPKGYYERTSTLTGRGVLFPSKVFKEIGFYNYEHYTQCGDTELPCRAKRNGYELVVSYDTPVYSYTTDKGHINHLEKLNLKSFKKYFFDIRSHTNIIYRFWFALDTTSNYFHGVWFFCLDMVRVTGHFIKKLKII